MKTELHIPLATIFKLGTAAIVILLTYVLWPMLMLLVMAILLAVALDPLRERLSRRMPRWFALLIVVTCIGGAALVVVGVVLPPLIDQLTNVLAKWPEFSRSVLTFFPRQSVFHQMGEKFLRPSETNVETWLPHLLMAGQFALGGIGALVLLYVFTIYLLIDGRCTYAWLRSFARPATQRKIDHTAREVTQIISAYVVGQVITSALCAVFVYALLRSLNVPAAVMLGVVAGVFDVLPIIGFFLSVLPSVVFALTVSPTVTFIVVIAYGAYHLFESYVIVPWVYGNRLRLSGLTVLLALLVGGTIGGVLGAIIILPLIASYPLIERVWLRPHLEANVVGDHELIQNADEGSNVGSTLERTWQE